MGDDNSRTWPTLLSLHEKTILLAALRDYRTKYADKWIDTGNYEHAKMMDTADELLYDLGE